MTMQEHLNTDTERKREIQRVKEVADNNNGFLSGSLGHVNNITACLSR